MPRRLLAAAALLALAACGGNRVRPAAAPDQLAFAGPTLNAAGTASWAPWPQAEHDARRSAASTATGPQTASLRWTRRLEGNATPGPVIGRDGTIYAASNAGVLHALDPATGADRWTFDGGGGYGSDLSTSAAVLADGTVLWPGPHNTIFALGRTGKLLWREVLIGQPTSPAVTAEGRVTVGDTSGGVTALAVSGRRHTVLWRAQLHGTSYGSVALSPTDAHRAYTTVDDQLVALDDARVAWRFKVGGQIEVSPAVAPDGTIVVGTNDRWEYAVSPAGSRIWRHDRASWSYSSPGVTNDGIAYFGDHTGHLNAVNARTGALVAKYAGGARHAQGEPGIGVGVWTAPLVDARHDVYWGTESGHVHGVDAAGNSLFDLALGSTVDSYPALGSDGLLVLGVADGRLLGIGSPHA